MTTKDASLKPLQAMNAKLLEESVNEFNHIMHTISETAGLVSSAESLATEANAVATIYAAKLTAHSNFNIAERTEEALNALTRQFRLPSEVG